MLKNMLNEVRLTYHIEATGPILIKEGETEAEVEKRKKKDKNSTDMVFVVDANKKVFIPGSSIRGVWRSWCEKIARTISDGVPLACDPFNDKEKDNVNLSCSKRLEKKEINTSAYAESCPICKIFGNTSIASRIRISDAYPIDANSGKLLDVDKSKIPVRDGIGIDRFTGGICQGPFRYQYLIGNTFKTEVQIRNFELWQLGLLGFLFRDLEEELVPIGFGKTKGLGKVKGTLKKAELIFYGFNKPNVVNNKYQIKGIGDLYNDKNNDEDSYCFDTGKSLDIDVSSTLDKTIKSILELDDMQTKDLFNKTAHFWASLKDKKPDGYFLEAQERRNQIMEGT